MGKFAKALDEMSNEKIQAYKVAAKVDKFEKAAAAKKGDKEAADKADKRQEGIDAANKRLATKAEGTEMGKFASLLGKEPVVEGEQVDEDTWGTSTPLKKKGGYENGNRKATVHRDVDWNEYRVKHHVDGVHQKEADYHTDDKEEAHDHAKHWVSQAHESTAPIHPTLKAFNEKADEFIGHRSDHTGQVYHVNPENHEALKNLKHGGSRVIEAVHHDGYNLHVRKYEANKVHNTVHLHDRHGNHVDSFKLQ